MRKISQLLILLLFTAATSYSQTTGGGEKKSDTAQLTNANKVELLAEPDGGKDSWETFLKKNINYDIPTFNEAPPGRYVVKVKFTVFKDGHLGDITPLTKYGYGMERELVHALKKSPDWHPAMQNGVPVNAYRVQTITFIVE